VKEEKEVKGEVMGDVEEVEEVEEEVVMVVVKGGVGLPLLTVAWGWRCLTESDVEGVGGVKGGHGGGAWMEVGAREGQEGRVMRRAMGVLLCRLYL
jgi:hypothetical protein